MTIRNTLKEIKKGHPTASIGQTRKYIKNSVFEAKLNKEFPFPDDMHSCPDFDGMGYSDLPNYGYPYSQF